MSDQQLPPALPDAIGAVCDAWDIAIGIPGGAAALWKIFGWDITENTRPTVLRRGTIARRPPSLAAKRRPTSPQSSSPSREDSMATSCACWQIANTIGVYITSLCPLGCGFYHLSNAPGGHPHPALQPRHASALPDGGGRASSNGRGDPCGNTEFEAEPLGNDSRAYAPDNLLKERRHGDEKSEAAHAGGC